MRAGWLYFNFLNRDYSINVFRDVSAWNKVMIFFFKKRNDAAITDVILIVSGSYI